MKILDALSREEIIEYLKLAGILGGESLSTDTLRDILKECVKNKLVNIKILYNPFSQEDHIK